MRSIPHSVALPALAAVLVAATAFTAMSVAAAAKSDLRGPGLVRPVGATVIVRAPVSKASAVVGDDVRVELVACSASCGYTWKVTRSPKPAVAVYVSTSYRRSTASKGLVGGNDIESVTFHAVGKGSTTITLKYYPPGKDRAPTKSYVLKLTVE